LTWEILPHIIFSRWEYFPFFNLNPSSIYLRRTTMRTQSLVLTTLFASLLAAAPFGASLADETEAGTVGTAAEVEHRNYDSQPEDARLKEEAARTFGNNMQEQARTYGSEVKTKRRDWQEAHPATPPMRQPIPPMMGGGRGR
jgi:hypothetical protein